MRDMNNRIIYKTDVLLHKGSVYKPANLVGLMHMYYSEYGDEIYALTDEERYIDKDKFIPADEVMVLDREEYPEWYI